MLQIGALTQKAAWLVEFWGRSSAEAGRLRSTDQVVRPKLPISRELVRCTISGILFNQGPDTAKRALAEVAPGSKIRINLGHPLCDQPAAKPVHHNVMIARIKIEPVGRHSEQGVSEK